MIEIKKPKISVTENESGSEAKFVIEPLERGYGQTLGNALRRLLLSALPGAAAIGIRIEGVDHEFSTIPGVREDVTEIILNLKGVAFKSATTDREFRKVLNLNKSEAGVVTAGDIEGDAEVEVLNPDHYICTLSAGAKLAMEITIGRGRGYVSADNNKISKAPIGYIPIDAFFAPVIKANYTVENTRVEQSIDFDKLTLDVTTNGTCSARQVVSLAAKILEDHTKLFVDLDETIKGIKTIVSPEGSGSGKLLEKNIEELEFTVRSYNCLKRASIHTVQDLIAKTEDDMLKVRNLGQKSLDEIKKKLEDLGLSLRNRDE
ncbi:MAG: DNA-directed RNA polymerase subunit alpha [Clostridia bacterium]|nr:DNA-directed RNA polymerase subunit alpha [Clostridia bacterium]